MKLHKALKLRKKVVGEIAKLKEQIQGRNSYTVGSLNAEKYNVRQLETELTEKIDFLVGLKCAINKANETIQDKIYILSELKGFLVMWQGMSVLEGTQSSGYREKDIEFKVQVDEKERDDKVKDLQETIDGLQETLDAYNYTTDITV